MVGRLRKADVFLSIKIAFGYPAVKDTALVLKKSYPRCFKFFSIQYNHTPVGEWGVCFDEVSSQDIAICKFDESRIRQFFLGRQVVIILLKSKRK